MGNSRAGGGDGCGARYNFEGMPKFTETIVSIQYT